MYTAVNLFEGGNVFKTAEGTPATIRIARENVVPTVQWLEQLTGLNLVDNMLGSTGLNPTSGDIDLGVDVSKISKDVLIQQLRNKKIKDTDIKKSGDAVHLKTPILGDPINGYVQVDFMFGNPTWQKFGLSSDPTSDYKGMYRSILLSSIAKELGYKYSPNRGLTTRDTNEIITQDPTHLAKILVNGTVEDIKSVESIIKKIKSRDDYEKLVATARETFAKDNLILPEERILPGTGAWYRKFLNKRV